MCGVGSWLKLVGDDCYGVCTLCAPVGGVGIALLHSSGDNADYVYCGLCVVVCTSYVCFDLVWFE